MTDSKARTSLRSRRRQGAPDASRGDAGDDARLFRLLRIWRAGERASLQLAMDVDVMDVDEKLRKLPKRERAELKRAERSASEKCRKLRWRIFRTPARTDEGMLAKFRAAAALVGIDGLEWELEQVALENVTIDDVLWGAALDSCRLDASDDPGEALKTEQALASVYAALGVPRPAAADQRAAKGDADV